MNQPDVHDVGIHAPGRFGRNRKRNILLLGIFEKIGSTFEAIEELGNPPRRDDLFSMFSMAFVTCSLTK